MPIAVVCSSCKARFQVSEKFAGKQGPCPKCKSIITIPKVEEQVQIHAPEEAAKVATGADAQADHAQGNEAPADSDRDRRLCDAGSARHCRRRRQDISGYRPGLRGIALFAVSIPISVAGYAFLTLMTSWSRIGANGYGSGPRSAGWV